MSEAVDLWDWRRKITDMYYDVRSISDVRAAWRLWCESRAEMFRTHPQSPIEPAGRMVFDGPVFFPYDPELRFLVRLSPPLFEHLAFETGADGSTAMHAFARTDGLRERLGAWETPSEKFVCQQNPVRGTMFTAKRPINGRRTWSLHQPPFIVLMKFLRILKRA